MLVSAAARLRRAGVPLWLLLSIGAVLLIGLLFRPTIEERLGVRLPMPRESQTAESAPIPDHEAENERQARRQAPKDADDADPARLADFFSEVKRGVFESPAGLLYRPGSAQGHRLKHVLAHAHDQPKRAGPHGVFDNSDPQAVFTLIDEAFQQAESGVKTRTRHEEGRTIYTVDLGRRVGYVGGESGNARGRPEARKIRLVLDGRHVITAYPVR